MEQIEQPEKPHEIEYLWVVFQNELSLQDIPLFRKAIIDTYQTPDSLLHQHEENKLIHRYPQIQYKNYRNKAAVFCVNDGISIFQKFLASEHWNLSFQSLQMNLDLDVINFRRHKLFVWNSMFDQTIKNWLPFNKDNYREYQKLIRQTDKLMYLENLLKLNIFAVCKNLGYTPKERIQVEITSNPKESPCTFKDLTMMNYSFQFRCNVILPENIGVGKAVSHGYGKVNRKYVPKQFRETAAQENEYSHV